MLTSWSSVKSASCGVCCTASTSSTRVKDLHYKWLWDDITYSCGAHLQELELSGKLGDVYIRDVRCYDPIRNFTTLPESMKTYAFIVQQKKV